MKIEFINGSVIETVKTNQDNTIRGQQSKVWWMKEKAMKVHILKEEAMREIGFTDLSEETWYYCKMVSEDDSFNLWIDKKTGEFQIDVLDEGFMQPYDYQRILQDNPDNVFAGNVRDKVEKIMLGLVDKGIINGYEVGDYI